MIRLKEIAVYMIAAVCLFGVMPLSAAETDTESAATAHAPSKTGKIFSLQNAHKVSGYATIA